MIRLISLITLVVVTFFSCSPVKKRQQVATSLTASNEEVSTISNEEDPVTIIFSGDLMQHIGQVRSARQPDGSYFYDSVFVNISDFWNSADFTVVNLETTISSNERYSGYPLFASPETLIGSLKRSGVDVLALANNHICDKGAAGIDKTLKTIEKEGLKQVGINNHVVFFNKKNRRIALLNFTYSTNGRPIPKGFAVNIIDTTKMKRQIDYAKSEKATDIIAFLHWGIEYRTRYNLTQKRMANWFKAQGVDFVIGSHPHVVQSVDTSINVAYSLGNLVSNQESRYTNGGVSIKLSIGDTIKAEYLPHWVDKASGYKILTPRDTVNNRNKLFIQSLSDNRRLVGNDISEVILGE